MEDRELVGNYQRLLRVPQVGTAPIFQLQHLHSSQNTERNEVTLLITTHKRLWTKWDSLYSRVTFKYNCLILEH